MSPKKAPEVCVLKSVVLKEAVTIGRNATKELSPGRGDPYLEEGIVYYTDKGLFGIPLSEVRRIQLA